MADAAGTWYGGGEGECQNLKMLNKGRKFMQGELLFGRLLDQSESLAGELAMANHRPCESYNGAASRAPESKQTPGRAALETDIYLDLRGAELNYL